MSKKNVFVNGESREILEMESMYYTIILGKDFYKKNNAYAFSLNQARKHFSNIVDDIATTLQNGTEAQKKAALKCLETLSIQPLKIH